MTAPQSPERKGWWISDGDVAHGGKKILGPFESRDLALKVRRLYEAHDDARGMTFWVSQDRAGAVASGRAASGADSEEGQRDG